MGIVKKHLVLIAMVQLLKKGILMTELEQIIGYTFKNPELLKEALTHSSYTNGKHLRSNERLEFLGDSVLSIVVSEHLLKILLICPKDSLPR